MIEVKTILNENLLRKFSSDQSKRNMWFPLVLTAIFFVLAIVGKVVGLLDTVITVTLVAVGCLLPIAYFLAVRFMLNRAMKSSPALQGDTKQTWRFLDSEIIFNESSKYVQAHDTRVEYDAIVKVVESDTAFYVYLSKYQAYILDAKGITVGSRLELHAFLLDKLGAKRVKYSKKLYSKK